MVRFAFRLLTPLLLFFSVMMFLSDFRLIAVGFAVAGYVSYLISEELRASG